MEQLSMGSFGSATVSRQKPPAMMMPERKPCIPGNAQAPDPTAARSTTEDEECDSDEELSLTAMRALARSVALGEADEASLETAADCLLMALPASMDSTSFCTPDRSEEAGRRRGVPLRLLLNTQRLPGRST